MMTVRLNDNQWLDPQTLTRFVRRAAENEEEPGNTLCIPHNGPCLIYSGSEEQALVAALEASEVRAFPFPMLTLAPHQLEEPTADPDTPHQPTMADVAEEILSMLRAQAAARAEDARLNLLQRMKRFVFGGAR